MFHFFSVRGKLLLAAAMLLISLFACKKDHLAPLPEGAGHQAKPNYPISLFEAMAHFSSVQGTAPSSLASTDFIDLDPRWSEAYLSQSQSGKEIVVVPLPDSLLRSLNDGRAGAKLLFSKNGPDTIVAEILVYAADSAYLAGKSTGPEFGDFTGQYLFFDIGYNFKYGIWVEDGALNGYVMTIDLQNTSGVSNSRDDSDPVEDCIDHVISEFITYQCNATEQVFWDCHAMIISTIAICHTLGGGGGGTGGSGGTGGGGYGTGGGTGGSGGSGNNNENPYSPFWDVFTGSLPMGIFVQSPSLLPPGFDTTLVRQFIDINRIFNYLPQQLIDLSNNPAYIQVLYNIFAPWVNVPITPENQANAPNFALVKPVTDFAIKHKLTAQQFEALLRNGALFGQVKNLSEQLDGDNDTANEYIGFCIDLMSIHSEYKWERLAELYNLVNADPNALIKNCEENGEGVEFWSDIASFVPPNSVIQRIENLPGNWNIQEIKNASGTRVNLDLFPVKITTMPTVNGVVMSKDDLISLIRLSLNYFTEGSSFTPFSPQDAQIWTSDDPLGAAIHISINPDDGSVVTSSYSSCCWVFTTLQAPFWDDGIHPVSGNRQFGYKQFSDGSIDIYTRAADRLTKWWHNLGETMAFDGADNLWEGFQEKISTFVIDNGGSAEVRSPIKYRPDWDKVKDALTKEYPLTSISCL